MYLLLIISSSALLIRYYFSHLILSWLFKIKSKFSLYFNTYNLLPFNSKDITDISENNTKNSNNSFSSSESETKPLSKLIKTKSYNILNTDTINKHYSYTYYFVSKKVPIKSKSVDYLNELIKNRSTNQIICCNPDCKKNIEFETYCAFDGYYCSFFCRKNAFNHIGEYWPTN